MKPQSKLNWEWNKETFSSHYGTMVCRKHMKQSPLLHSLGSIICMMIGIFIIHKIIPHQLCWIKAFLLTESRGETWGCRDSLFHIRRCFPLCGEFIVAFSHPTILTKRRNKPSSDFITVSPVSFFSMTNHLIGVEMENRVDLLNQHFRNTLGGTWQNDRS